MKHPNTKNMVWIILILVAAICFCTDSFASTVVDSGECDDGDANVTWTLDDEGLLVIQGNGLITWHPWIEDHKEEIKQLEIRSGVTGIDCLFAFGDCENLTKVSLPDTLVKIDEYTFDACSSLTQITLPKGLEKLGSAAFRNCTSLAAITIPDKITVIESHLFENCSGLKKVSVPAGLKTIGFKAFLGCASLTEFAFPEGLTKIEGTSFSNCTSLTKVSLPDTVDTLESHVFSGCTGLTDIRFPDQLALLSQSLCAGCSALKNVTLPTRLVTITDYCFSRCGSLAGIHLPVSVKYIRSDAFADSSGLKDVYYGGTVEDRAGMDISSSGNESLINAVWHYQADADPANPDNPTNPPAADDSTPTVGDLKYRISGSGAVVTGPKNKNAKKLTIPKTISAGGKTYKVIEIKAGAFKSMKKLTAVSIGANIKTIGKGAFQNCAKLKTITINTQKLTSSSVKSSAFKGISKNATFKCPKGLKDSYKKILTKKGAPKTCKFK